MPTSRRGRSNVLAILLGAFVAVNLLGLVAMVVASWVLNKSFDALVDQMLSDTGWFGTEIYAEDIPEDEERGAFVDDDVEYEE